MKKIIFIVLIVLAIGFVAYYFFYFRSKPSIISSSPSPTSQASPSTSPFTAPISSPQPQFVEPVKDFKTRVTKKPFGLYITPQNSPVQPERFIGYHTGADAEYEDVTADVPVYAIADGEVIYSNRVSGYGGVFILKIDIDDTSHSALYGHIRPSTLPEIGKTYKKNEQIAVLGTGYSTETDGERRHLHLGILSNDRIDVKGYVSSQSALSGWIDPLSLSF